MAERKTLLVVGGRLCRSTVAILNDAEWTVIGLRRNPVEAVENQGIAWHAADLRQPESLMSVFEDSSVPAITHVLYAPSPDGRTPSQYADVYSEGLPRFISCLKDSGRAKQLQRMLLVTSTAVWGPSNDWVDETTPPDETGFRAQCLLEAEAALQHLSSGVGVALRLSGLYGERHMRWLASRLKSGEITVPDGTGHWANRIHEEDAARACAHLLQVKAPPHALYIVTDSTPTEKAELYDAVCEELGGPPPERQWREPTGKRLSNARLRSTGWVPQWPDTLEGYRACARTILS